MSTETVRTRIRGGKSRQIVRCKRCGVVRKGDLDPNHHRTLHANNQQVEEIDVESLSAEYKERNFVDIDRRIEAIEPFLNGEENVLDLGTGMGYFLDRVEPKVNEAIGTEINEKRISFVRDELEFPVFRGTEHVLEEFGESYFDVVTMFHSLEHLINPVEQLEMVWSLLDIDGHLFVEVPNHDDWLLMLSDAYAGFYYQDAHSYYLDPGSLERILDISGFRSEISGVQRYSIWNALHWLLHGEPELSDPTRHRDTFADPVDKIYGAILSALGRSDTLWAVCRPDAA